LPFSDVWRQAANPMKTTGLLFILVCATSLSVPAQTALENDDAQTVRSLEHAWFEAQSHNDNRALDLNLR
jgi:hypothetical protein